MAGLQRLFLTLDVCLKKTYGTFDLEMACGRVSRIKGEGGSSSRYVNGSKSDPPMLVTATLGLPTNAHKMVPVLTALAGKHSA